MKATWVRNIDNEPDRRSVWKLYRLSEPYVYEDSNGEGKTEYVIASAAVVERSGPETYIFPASEDGDVISWGELPGSYRGGLDHEEAIRRFEEQVA